MIDREVYDTALYLRLSKDDKDVGGSKIESNSISSQRDLLYTYIQNHVELKIFDIYIDDGYSGSNFDRPEFKRMMEDVYTGKVNCVIVKDLSRFGRDYIEAGRFIQKAFPALNVRFIAVIDNYDSLYADNTDKGLILPVKNFVNDSYCRDISTKVKAQQNIKRIEGKCISAFSPYGYQRNPDDKNRLIVDKYAANIVKNIFAWKMVGMSMAAIADKLNTAGVLSPMEYKKSLGIKYYTGFEGSVNARWAATSVKRILINQVYIGNMVQGKQEKINYKLKKRINKPEDEWICVKHTHEAIVSEMEFWAVQDLLKYDGRASQNTDKANLFSGILICADCKAPMIKRANTYKGRKKVFFICQTKNNCLGCSRHSVSEEQLKRIIFKEIKKYLKLLVSYSEIVKYLDDLKVNYNQVKDHKLQVATLHEQYIKYYNLRSNLIFDLEDGLIDEKEFDEFHNLYGEKCVALERNITSQKKTINKMFHNGILAKFQIDKMKETLQLSELSRELLITTVKKIYIHEDKRMEIEFRFKNEMDKLATSEVV